MAGIKKKKQTNTQKEDGYYKKINSQGKPGHKGNVGKKTGIFNLRHSMMICHKMMMGVPGQVWDCGLLLALTT